MPVSNGAWRLHRWDIHLVWKHLFTIALKWRLHWNCFKYFFSLSQVNVPKVQSYPQLPSFYNLPTFDWTELFCELLSIWTNVSDLSGLPVNDSGWSLLDNSSFNSLCSLLRITWLGLLTYLTINFWPWQEEPVVLCHYMSCCVIPCHVVPCCAMSFLVRFGIFCALFILL